MMAGTPECSHLERKAGSRESEVNRACGSATAKAASNNILPPAGLHLLNLLKDRHHLGIRILIQSNTHVHINLHNMNMPLSLSFPCTGRCRSFPALESRVQEALAACPSAKFHECQLRNCLSPFIVYGQKPRGIKQPG